MPYPAALAATLLIEVPIFVIALVTGGVLTWPRALAAAVGLNLATHPLAWQLLNDATTSWPRFLAVECGVWLAEAGLLIIATRRDPALIAITALTANTGSCLAGVGMSQLGW